MAFKFLRAEGQLTRSMFFNLRDKPLTEEVKNLGAFRLKTVLSLLSPVLETRSGFWKSSWKDIWYSSWLLSR